jgi:hypothetical protein
MGMFGQKDDNENNDNQATTTGTDPAQSVGTDSTGVLPVDLINGGPPPIASATTAPPTDPAWQHPGAPIDDEDPLKDIISPAGGFPSAATSRINTDSDVNFPLDSVSEEDATTTPDPTPAPALVSNDDVSDAELIEIKQKALSELVPLIDKLDQPPQEKFRTIMMMIQASDDQRLVEKAYESAHAIEDEEARAQALLDIVNEINYFTQQPENQ